MMVRSSKVERAQEVSEVNKRQANFTEGDAIRQQDKFVFGSLQEITERNVLFAQ